MPRVVLEKHYGAAKKAIWAGLAAYNRSVIGTQPGKTVVVSVKDEGAVAGGVVGEVWAGWLFIQLFWLQDALRGRNLGSEALQTLEAEARRLGATQAYVDTFSFQAPDFYRKLGYHEFGRLDGWPLGHSRYWMTKAL